MANNSQNSQRWPIIAKNKQRQPKVAKTRPKMSNYAVFAFAFMHLVVNFNGIMQLFGPLLSFPSWNIMTINFHRIFLVKFQEKKNDFLTFWMIFWYSPCTREYSSTKSRVSSISRVLKSRVESSIEYLKNSEQLASRRVSSTRGHHQPSLSSLIVQVLTVA